MRRGWVAALALVGGVTLAASDGPTLVSGLDPSTFDRSVRPQDDLFRYVNGRWIADAEIPGDKASYGAFGELSDRAEVDVRAIIEPIASSGRHRQGSLAQQIGDLYTSMLDEAHTEVLAATPIEPELKKIDAIASTRDLAAETGYLATIAAGGPFGGSVALDAANPSQLVVQIAQGGTLLPDREYYLSGDARYTGIRREYERYLTTIFALTHHADAAGDAHAVLALETALAGIEWTQTDSRDPAKTSTRYSLGELGTKMPGFDWVAWAKPQRIDRAQGLILAQPSFFKAFAEMVPSTPLPTWRAWLAARYITALAPYLSRPFSDARFEFFGHVLSGQTEVRVAWKRAVGLVNSFMGDAVGKLYVERHFSPADRRRAERLVANVLDAYRRSIKRLDWMSAATRQGALDKLSHLTTKVGYPDVWRDYTGLIVRPDDLVGNLTRARIFDNEHRMNRLRATSDPGEWLITPQTVNAYYNPALNEIVLPAAMLQPPLFTPGADDAVNYGGIGAVIGHEIGHGFDGLGRGFDASGTVRDWWTPADDHEFRLRALRVVNQFNAYSPMEGLHINGVLTLGENIGDLGGLSIAYQAYHLSLNGKPAPVIDGLTGDQRFFLGWARIWRVKYRDEYLRQTLLAQPYAPEAYRANGPVGNLEAFYAAFDVKPGDGMYRAPKDRVVIW